MIRHYLLFSLRLLKSKNGSFAFNVIGLSLGFFSSLSALYLLTTETGYNKKLPNNETLARVITFANRYETAIATTAFNLAPEISSSYPEINAFCRTSSMMVDVEINQSTSVKEEVLFVDTSFIEMFGYEIIHGEKNSTLESPYSLVITENYAKKLFGDIDPIGKVVKVSWYKYTTDLIVTGIIKNPYSKTTISFNLLGNISLARKYHMNKDLDIGKSNGDGWIDMNYITYVNLQDLASRSSLENNLNSQGVEDYPGYFDISYRVQPLTDLYFSSMEVQNDPSPHGNKNLLIIVNVIGFVILLISSINFIILSTSQAIVRSKELGIRKVFGANSGSLLKQVFSEYTLYSLIAIIIALVIIELFYPVMGRWLGKDVDFSLFNNLYFIPGIALVLIVTVFLSTLYLNLFITRSNPIQSISGMERKLGTNNTFQIGLIGLQLLFFCIVISSLISVNKQIRYIRNSNLGIEMENLLVLSNPVISEKRDCFTPFKELLLKDNSIQSITTANGPVLPSHNVEYFPMNMVGMEDETDNVYCNMLNVNYDFIQTFGIRLSNGKPLTKENFPVAKNCCLITESGVKAFGISDPIGTKISILDGAMYTEVVGVVEDFSVTSYYNDSKPIILSLDPGFIDYYYLRWNRNEDFVKVIQWIEKTWEEVFPGYSFVYSFYSEDYEKLYHRTNSTFRIIIMFSVFATILCVIGLFGISSHISTLKIKEMSLRHLYGASVERNLFGVFKPMLFLTVLCNIISIPLGIIILGNWLNQFAFDTTYNFLQILLTFSASLAVVMIAVGGNFLRTVNRPIAVVLKERE